VDAEDADDAVELSVQTLVVHGHERAFVDAGTGPALLLLHGIGSNLHTWDRVLPLLVRRGFRVIAPDFLGHGCSAKPRADYSLGGFANGMRDLLTILGVERATVVGHSFGGGVAMQFAYQFPERTQRVVLVGSGGLGQSVHPLLRVLTLPGSGAALAVMSSRVPRLLGRASLLALQRSGLAAAADLAELAVVWDGLVDPKARAAFLHVLRAAVDWRGQVVTMVDRAYLASHLPVRVIWGGRDTVIPAAHAGAAQAALPNAQVEIFERSAHFPHRDEPDRFTEALVSFIRTTSPAEVSTQEWRDALLAGH
jgi:pimeloyl-ACP methyl ester carboxylesterase